MLTSEFAGGGVITYRLDDDATGGVVAILGLVAIIANRLAANATAARSAQIGMQTGVAQINATMGGF